ncbi:MAG: c-type cytochrome, partial [Solirubrobacterales bacterium]
PGPELTQIGARIPRNAIARSLQVGPSIMPSYGSLPPAKFQALTAGILTIVAMAYLTYLGATAGPPSQVDLKTSAALEPGQEVVAQSGCLACHKLGDNGNDGPGPELTHIGARLPSNAIARSLEVGPSIMPSYSGLTPQ